MVRRGQAFANHVSRIVRAWTRLLLLTIELHVEVAQLLSHRVVHGATDRSKAVLLAISVGAGQIVILLLQDLVDMNFLHGGAGHTEGVGERSTLGLGVDRRL